MTKEQVGKFTLLNARLSFPSLFEPNVQKQDDGTIRENWKANFLLENDRIDEMEAVFRGKRMSAKEAITLASNEAKAAKWGDDKAKWPKLKPDRKFFRDGNLENWDGYEDAWYISANAQLTDRPSIITNRKDGNGKWIEAEPGGKASPYAGCYTNAVLVIWCQDNEHGKRINAQVKAVQFFADGEAFSGAGPVDPNEEFSDDMAGAEGSIGGDFDDGDDDANDMV